MSHRILDEPASAADLRLPYGPEPLQFGELRLPSGPGPHPLAIVLHGGFWRARYDLGYMGHLCAALAAAGVATWNVEYRRLGQPGSGWPGTFLDVARAADHVYELAPRYDLDLARVVTVGHSAGGHLALWLAARGRILPGDALYSAEPLPLHGAVALAGVVDLQRAWELALSDRVVDELMGGAPQEYPARYATASPAALLPLGVQQVLVHGTADANAPYALSRDYQAMAAACGDDAQLVTLPGAGHFEPVDPCSAAWPTVLRAIVQA